MSILRTSKNKLRPFAALLGVFALMTLSLGSAVAHHASGSGADSTAATLWLTSVTDNGDLDEDDVAENDTDEAEPPNASDDNGDVDEDTVDENDQGDSVDENDQGEDDNSADENDQGQDEQSDENDDQDNADESDDSGDHDEADDGGGGGGDENDDDGEGGDD